jgi:hypothetical protein
MDRNDRRLAAIAVTEIALILFAWGLVVLGRNVGDGLGLVNEENLPA